ncbi:coenzyme Q-binding protein COQ10 [Entomortierella parvispora]|uniref:Coenzyme Q-binding protein COQ10 n=1 Tax=Entomortierella parvispora TaxID=205924 RepID=A0A9P3LUB7_9FUNG|nr:coenzyme Q-binding protein COQ10 [Entomortierella parvispora]
MQGILGLSSARSHLRDPLSKRHQLHHGQCRALFSLPKMPKLPNLPDILNVSSSRHYKDRTLLRYSQQEFYDVVANVDDYHKFLPWCTYSKMSPPVQETDTTADKNGRSDLHDGGWHHLSPNMKPTMAVVGSTSSMQHQPRTTVRHGELGIGFNSMQERYVSTVTCQEPWMVRAVSYDSTLFKELSTTWKFTPNAPKTTSLEAAMDQEVNEETSLLTKPVQESPPKQPPPPPPPQLTAAAVFGASALPSLKTIAITAQPTPSSSSSSSSSSTSTTTSSSSPFPAPPKPTILRTASPSNLGTMKPSDYPSVWVDFEIQFEFSSPVHASMSSLFFDQVSKEMLQAFVMRAEALYGKRY